MKRLIFYILITALVVWLPVQGADVGKLRPVQLVEIRREGELVVIRTDTGDRGQGRSAAEALEQLHRTTPATVYLDTAEFLLVHPAAREDATYPAELLKEGVQVFESSGVTDLKAAAEYLSVHSHGISLTAWKQGALPPVLQENEGRFSLLKNIEKTA